MCVPVAILFPRVTNQPTIERRQRIEAQKTVDENETIRDCGYYIVGIAQEGGEKGGIFECSAFTREISCGHLPKLSSDGRSTNFNRNQFNER